MVASDWHSWYIVCSCLSILSALFIAVTYFKLIKFRHHPSRILLSIALMEGMLAYHTMVIAVGTREYEDSIQVVDASEAVLFGETISRDSICWTNFFAMEYSSIGAILFNAMLCVDLMLMLRNPFSPPRKRNRIFFVISILLPFISIKTVLDNQDKSCLEFVTSSERIKNGVIIPSGTVATFLLAYVILGTGSSLYAAHRFRNSLKLAEKSKIYYIKRHTAYVSSYLAMYVLPVLVLYFNHSDDQIRTYGPLCNIMKLLTCFLLFIVRITEPYFWAKLKYYILSKVNKTTEAVQSQMDELKTKYSHQNHSLLEIIHSSLNVELVNGILIGIGKAIASSKGIVAEKDTKTNAKELSKRKIKHSLSDNDVQEFLEVHGDKTSIIGKMSFTVTEFAPQIFKSIRDSDGLMVDEILSSLSLQHNRQAIFSAEESQGKSGSFFFFSENGRYLIKTINDEEKSVLLNQLLPDYSSHLFNTNDSLIAFIYGVYQISIDGMKALSVILMQNTIQYQKPEEILGGGSSGIHPYQEKLLKVFDLKGSTVQRKAKGDDIKASTALKDLDFVAQGIDLDLSDEQKDRLARCIYHDAKLLEKHGLMDYSLLLAIVERVPSKKKRAGDGTAKLVAEESNEEEDGDIVDAGRRADLEKGPMKFFVGLAKLAMKRKSRNMIISRSGKYVYHIGIIDYLQWFNKFKYIESKYKSIVYFKNAKFVSAVDPVSYSNRFINFMWKVVLDFKYA